MQVVSFNARVLLRPAVRATIQRRLKEAIRLIVTRGAVVEDLRDWPQLVFHVEVTSVRTSGQVDSARCVMSHSPWSRLYSYFCTHTDCTYMALPTTAMFRMPFSGQLGVLRSALDSLRQGIPEVERNLWKGEYRNVMSVGSTLKVSQRKRVQC
jgi:hypothetical protein